MKARIYVEDTNKNEIMAYDSNIIPRIDEHIQKYVTDELYKVKRVAHCHLNGFDSVSIIAEKL